MHNLTMQMCQASKKLLNTCLVALALCLISNPATGEQLSVKSELLRVETDSAVYIGQLLTQGSSSNETAIRGFFGVPYAQPPMGQLRFAPPLAWQPPHSNGTAGGKPELLANSSRPWCPQKADPDGMPARHMSEDCLYLNIQTPVPHQNFSVQRPVLAWLHNGFLETGGISEPEAPLGCELVARQRLLLVEIGFRLGALGFLRLPGGGGGGNWGLLDQQMALGWIGANIRPFGGDPGRVILAGAGSGASSAGLHLLSRGSQRLFHGAALLGGGPLAPWLFISDASAVAAITDDFVTRASCRRVNDSETVRCLRDADAIALTNLLPPANRPLDVAAFPVVVDGSFITEGPASGLLDPRIIAAKPVIIGVTDREGEDLAVRAIGDRNASALTGPLYQDVLDEAFRFYPSLPHRLSPTGRRLVSGHLTAFPSSTAPRFNRQLLSHGLALWHTVCPSNRFADALCNASVPTFVYQFTEPRPFGDGASHGEDAAYFMGEPFRDHRYGEPHRDLSSLMMSALAEFATSGIISSVNWSSSSPGDLEAFHFSISSQGPLPGGVSRQHCQFWQDQLAWINSLDPSTGTTALTSTTLDAELDFWTRCNSTVNTVSIAAISVAGGLLLLLCLSICVATSRRRSPRESRVENLRAPRVGGSDVEMSRLGVDGAGRRVQDVKRPGFRPGGHSGVVGREGIRQEPGVQQRTEAAGSKQASRPGRRPKKT